MVRIESDHCFHMLAKTVWSGFAENEQKSIVIKLLPNQQAGMPRMGFSVDEYFRSDIDKEILEYERADVVAHLSDSFS